MQLLRAVRYADGTTYAFNEHSQNSKASGVDMLIVEMTLISGDGYLEMQVKTWRNLLGVAKSFGWQPKGTQPNQSAAERDPKYLSYFECSYDVKEYSKNFSSEDALALSSALMAACAAVKSGEFHLIESSGPVWLSDSMDQQAFDQINADLDVAILRLAEFSAKGEFSYSWDD